MYDLERFINAQENNLFFPGYQKALAEVKNGLKTTHWIWYIFPQLKALSKNPSSTAEYFGIEDIDEACAYIKHPILRARLIEISEALMQLEGVSSFDIFGNIDAIKVRSCMTLFHIAAPEIAVFSNVINKYYDGRPDGKTIELLNGKQNV